MNTPESLCKDEEASTIDYLPGKPCNPHSAEPKAD